NNGQVLASSGSDKTIRLWNPVNGQAIATLGAHSAGVNAVLLAPGGNAAYSVGDDGQLKFWKLPVIAPRNLAATMPSLRPWRCPAMADSRFPRHRIRRCSSAT